MIAWAIGLTQPSMAQNQREAYAKVVQKEARQRAFDPLTLVSLVHFESRWIASAVSPDGEDHGLGQIRARYVKGCRSDRDPVRHPSPTCKAAKARLLDGSTNIRRTAAAITANRKFCRKKTGRSALWRRWMPSYGGMNSRRRGVWCNQVRVRGSWKDLPIPKQIRRIMNYRRMLIRRLRAKKKK